MSFPISVVLVVGLALFLLVPSTDARKQPSKPHVVFILADDYGFNDIGYHGVSHGSAIKTPFLDSLAMSGIRLENYYVQTVCSPTRSQLMSGRYQIHTGLQHNVIWPSQRNGIPLDDILIPQQLKHCGYDTHMIGKWHLGFFEENYTPWKRGFDTYFGFLIGGENYYTRYRCYESMCGYSMDSEKGPTNETFGEYSAHLFARKAGDVIDKHNQSNPMFMYVAFQSVHSPLQVPDEYVKPYADIKDDNRRTYAGMVGAMDEAIKNINNWPLRGRKNSLWEGGVRAVGFVHGKMLNVPNPNVRTNDQLMHVSDWYPTLLHATGCPAISGTQSLDGFDQWKTITAYAKSPRTEILHNIDPLSTLPLKKIVMGFDTSVHAAIRVGDWKLLTGDPGDSRWILPPELQSLSKFSMNYSNIVKQQHSIGNQTKTIQLFNVKYDPFERTEVSDVYPEIVKELLSKLVKYNSTAVPVKFPQSDPAANPDGGFWKPWVK